MRSFSQAIRTSRGTRVKFALLMILVMALGLMLLLPEMMMMPARNPQRLTELFDLHASGTPPGVSPDHHPRLADALGDYLAGKTRSPQAWIYLGDTEEPAFTQREVAHLQDVRELFQLARSLAFLGIFLLLVPIALAVKIAQCNPRPAVFLYARWLMFALLLTLLLLGMLALLVMVDFTGAFTVFHQVLFDNELWRLNPQSDLLVQLMPEPFFVDYFLTSLSGISLSLVGLLALCWVVSRALRSARMIFQQEEAEGG